MQLRCQRAGVHGARRARGGSNSRNAHESDASQRAQRHGVIASQPPKAAEDFSPARKRWVATENGSQPRQGRKNNCYQTLIALCIAAIFAAPLSAAQSGTSAVEAQRFDGNWWRTTSAEERTAFVTGSEECHTFDRKVVRKSRWSDEDYARAVDRYYQKNPSEAASPVSLVMDKLNLASPIPQPRRRTKNPTKPAHGALDGTWWRSAAGDEQLGYVEGYLSCRLGIRTAKPLHFSQRALDYVQMTSRYYADDAKHEPEKLADVLTRFRDEPPKTGKR